MALSKTALRGRAYNTLLGRYWWREEAASTLGFKTVEDAHAAYRQYWEELGLPRWTEKDILDAVLAFFDKHGRWPKARDWKMENKLPSMSTVRLQFNTQLHEPSRGAWYETPSNWGKSGWTAVQEQLAQQRKLTPTQILTLPNVTVRRDAMERYGIKKLTKDKSCELVAEDEFGKLWRFGTESGYLMVEVTNSTPEPDGSFAHYFLRVPPDMTCPKQAIAWTFDIEEGWENYTGGVET